MAISTYDELFLTDEQKRQLKALTEQWERANAAGDEAGKAAAHRAAEAIRATAGYSGGGDGVDYKVVDTGYTPQVDAVNDLYDAAARKAAQSLRETYERKISDAAASGAGITEQYQAVRNAASAGSLRDKRDWAEYAVGRGLNTGAEGQAELARRATLRGEMAAIDAAESDARRKLEEKIEGLRRDYANALTAAEAQNALDRAKALLEEYRKAGK